MKRSVIFTFCILIGGVTGCSQSTIQKQESKSKMELASDSWTVTPPFDLLVTAADGDNVNYRILGQPDTFGFTHSPLVANKPHKSLWFYFGEEEILDVPIQIKAVKKEATKSTPSTPAVFMKALRPVPTPSTCLPSSRFLHQAHGRSLCTQIKC
ncbi:hypothetical protein ACUMHR_17000 [Rossellomorea marisflavi]|uniref:hypothetical protein n=1 Tax=Rossellomorea marisflavi TaxID=189381 RepID=UPI004043E6F5